MSVKAGNPPDCLGSHAGAVEKTRTSTGFRPQRPQRCASTSSATTALMKRQHRCGAALGRARPLAKRSHTGNDEGTVHFGTILTRLVTMDGALHYGARNDRPFANSGGLGFA